MNIRTVSLNGLAMYEADAQQLEPVYTTKSGARRLVSELHDEHLRNALRKLHEDCLDMVAEDRTRPRLDPQTQQQLRESQQRQKVARHWILVLTNELLRRQLTPLPVRSKRQRDLESLEKRIQTAPAALTGTMDVLLELGKL